MEIRAQEEREAEQRLREAAEDEMSDEEIQRQIELQKMFRQQRQMRELGEDKLYSRYTNVKAQEKAEADYLDKMIVDIETQPQSRSTTVSQVPSSFSNSKVKQLQQNGKE